MMIKLTEIIETIKPLEIVGSIEGRIISMASDIKTHNNSDEVIIWVSEKNQSQLNEINHGVILCSSISNEIKNENCVYLICDNPRLAFQTVLTAFFLPKREIGISKNAIISSSVKLGKDVFIGQNVVIESDCIIGNKVSINHNSVIQKNTIIGSNVKIGCNCVIGGEGFGFEKDETGIFSGIPHLGNVVLGDDVEIGNNVCIDRAILGSTILEKNVKLDNLVHIAHGVQVGENTLIIANATICGSVKIGKNCWIAPSSTVLNKKTIGDNVMVGLAALVMTNVPDNTTVMGSPADVLDDYKRKQFLLKKMIRK